MSGRERAATMGTAEEKVAQSDPEWRRHCRLCVGVYGYAKGNYIYGRQYRRNGAGARAVGFERRHATSPAEERRRSGVMWCVAALQRH